MKDIYLYCEITSQSHSKALKHLKKTKDKEFLFINLIEQVREFHPGMGLRCIYNQFKPNGIGRDRFIALGLENGFRLRKIGNPVVTTRAIKSNRYKNLLANKWLTDVNQVWVSDLFYFSLNGQHYYVDLIMDLYSRRIIGYCGSDNMRAENNVKALAMALKLRGIGNYNQNLIHHSDRGSQYISEDYTGLLLEYGIQISMCTNVLENAHAERVNGTIKNDYLNRWDIRNEKEFYQKVDQAVISYNNRIHQSINNKTPIEYEVYIKDIPLGQREKLPIFTINKKEIFNPDQLSLF